MLTSLTMHLQFAFRTVNLIILLLLVCKGINKRNKLINKRNNHHIIIIIQRGQCWCGDSVGKYGVAKCTQACLGDKTQLCGGPYINSVYAIKSKNNFMYYNNVLSLIDCLQNISYIMLNIWSICLSCKKFLFKNII